ncbi:hypothetical protein [Nitratifractor sp.]
MSVLRGTVTPGIKGVTAAPSQEPHPVTTPRLLRPASSGLATPPSPPSAPPSKRKLLDQMGIEVGGGEIRIDTRKTREFFRTIGAQLNAGADRGVQRARQHTSGVKDIGIHIEKDKVEIDLNKTKNFLKVWGEAMKILGEELEKSLKTP